ncbi:hypothetical protein E8E13_011042 [Curvularia kusanoi]|uniref:Uncharacterized protein n=1 Tax=Curvularia kusanoi TaxID=90978 RepID=A0A9P4TK24_CURKU|nr:hypothetical protein E8E13_011042 [Curvularia kusanoi]
MSQSAKKGSDEDIRHLSKAEVEALFHDGSDEEGKPGLSVWDIPPFRDESDKSNKTPVPKGSTNKTLSRILKTASRESISRKINETKKMAMANAILNPDSKINKKITTKTVKQSSAKITTTPSSHALGNSTHKTAEESAHQATQDPAARSNKKFVEDTLKKPSINSASKTADKIAKRTTDQLVKKSAKEATRSVSIKNKMKARKEATEQDTNTVSDKPSTEQSTEGVNESRKNSYDTRILRQTAGYHGRNNGRLSAVYETHAPGVPLNNEPYFTPPEPSRELVHEQEQNSKKRRHCSGDATVVEKTKKRRLSLLRAFENSDFEDTSDTSA